MNTPAASREEAPVEEPMFRAVLTPNRSLSPRGFLILMTVVSLFSFVAGLAFCALGAWPVMGFFGLDVAIIYLAFRINYRAGRAHELVELTHDLLSITHVSPGGLRKIFSCNPYWARVDVRTAPDGRSSLRILTQGEAHTFGHVLNHAERREFAQALKDALFESRSGLRI